MSQIKKGAVLNYITIFLTNVIGLLMTPFILSHLGNSEYGIYLAIGALVGTISLLDFGLNNAVVRFVAKYKAENDKRGEENFLATTMLLYIIISSLVVIIGVIFYFFLIDSYFDKMSPNEIEISKVIFGILIFNLAVGLPGGALTGICNGYEDFVFPKSLNIVRYVLRSFAVVGVLMLGGKAIALVVVDSIFNVFVIVITGLYLRKKLKITIKLHNFSFTYIKQIFSYSSWIFVFGLVSIFQWKSGYWILVRIDPDLLTLFGIGITLGTYYGAFSSAISSVFLPRATKMSVQNASGEELTDMMIKIGRISFIILMFILTSFILFGEQFVFLWVGDKLGIDGSRQSWIIAIMIMLGYTLPLVQGFSKSVLEAKGKLRFRALTYLSFMILGTILGGFLALKHGALGMVLGSVIGWLIIQFIMNLYFQNKIKLNIIRFFKQMFHKMTFPLLLSFTMGYVISYMPGIGWLNFIIKCSIYFMIYSLLMYYLGIIEFEKELFKKTISKLKINKK